VPTEELAAHPGVRAVAQVLADGLNPPKPAKKAAAKKAAKKAPTEKAPTKKAARKPAKKAAPAEEAGDAE
jgi:topoisomerase IA-like protein